MNESDEFNGNTFCIDRFQKIGVDSRVSSAQYVHFHSRHLWLRYNSSVSIILSK